jgi:hypothetical protein
VVVLGGAAWYIASQQKGIIASLLLGYTVFVGGVVVPTLGTFVRQRFGLTSAGALWAVLLGGVAAFLGKIQGGAAMKAILPDGAQWFLGTVLGKHYLSILPILLSILTIIVVSKIRGETAS